MQVETHKAKKCKPNTLSLSVKKVYAIIGCPRQKQ